MKKERIDIGGWGGKGFKMGKRKKPGVTREIRKILRGP